VRLRLRKTIRIGLLKDETATSAQSGVRLKVVPSEAKPKF
jgi:hypothetical protein